MTQRQFTNHHNCLLCFKKGAGRGGRCRFQQARQPLPKDMEVGPLSRTMRDLHPWVQKTGPSPLVGLEGRASHQAKESQDLSNLKMPWSLHCRFWVCLGPVTPFLSPISPFWNGKGKMDGNVYLMLCPIIAFWKHIICQVSQVHNQQGIFAFFESHPYLI